jgi:ferredoxin
MSWKLRIVEGSCCGFANCALRCPEVFAVDPRENRVRLLEDQVPEHLLPQVQQAIAECPTRAIDIFYGETAP